MKFLEATLRHLVKASDYAATADHISSAQGWLQRLDPRVKIAGLLVLLVIAAASHELTPIALVLVFACLLAWRSLIPLNKLARWVWLPVLVFTGIIALPAAFLSPGPRARALSCSPCRSSRPPSLALCLSSHYSPGPAFSAPLRCRSAFRPLLSLSWG